MIKCPGCGEENPPKFKLCGYCGTPLAPAAAALPPQEIRKTVTIVFTDLKDSTALGERLDSEALHEVKERYFSAMAAEIKRHGGKIEKYIGDAIMAVFGLPRAHEDDALRAVRAAVGMREVLGKVNAGLRERFGVELTNRTGVNTGEVVATGDPNADQKLATGDAVNVTARLEAAAPANEIYIGDVTYRLVRDAVEVEAVEPLTLKGKSQPVPAFRLLKVHGGEGNVRRSDTALVGRDAELHLLQVALDEAIGARRARLVTVIGDAGVGKSRLVREFMQRSRDGGAQVITGRCLPYGDGITFWPLREMVVLAAGIRQDDAPDVALAKLTENVGDAQVAERLASAAGFHAAAFPLQEIYWAARKFVERRAAAQPIVAMIDDIHWAETAFLDLLTNLLDTVEDAPVLILATARHELLEARADWGERDGARRLVLQPLGEAATAQVVENLLGGSGLPETVLARIVSAAEGNPLYVEQVLSMLLDNGALRQQDGRWVADRQLDTSAVPPTIHALLEARLDRLDRTERAAAEPAAVIGMEFQCPAVEALAPAALKDKVAGQLDTLSRKQFIRAVQSSEKALLYRFHHHLVRETVYNGLLKRTRATLHAEFVKWADALNAGTERGQEFEAILGYHLEQAHRYLGELGPLDEAGVALGRDAARRLASAGRRAFARGDSHAATNLFRRATAVLAADDPERPGLLAQLGEAHMDKGDFADANAVLEEAVARAAAQGNARVRAHGELIRMYIAVFSGAGSDQGEQMLAAARELVAALDRESAHAELATAWRLIVQIHGIAGRYRMADEALARSMDHARRAGDDRAMTANGLMLANLALLSPTPVREAIAQCERLLADGLGDRQVEAKVMCALAQLRAMNGDLAAARDLYQRARALLRDLGRGVLTASTAIDVALVELHGGDLAEAEREVRSEYDFLGAAGEVYTRSTVGALLARLVRDQGRDAEALELTEDVQRIAAPEDVDSQAMWRAVRAPILARRGEAVAAEALAREAVDLVGTSEAPGVRAYVLDELAAVLLLLGKPAEAATAMAESRALYDAKGDSVMSHRLERGGMRAPLAQ